MNGPFTRTSAAFSLRRLRARAIHPPPLARREGESRSRFRGTPAVKALWKSGINRCAFYSVFHSAALRPLTAPGIRVASRPVVSLLEKNCMSNSFPKRNLPLRVILNRVGEATLAQYGVACSPMDCPEAACRLWREVVADEPGFEPDKEHLVAVLLNTKLRMIGYHVVSVGSLNEAVAHPREIFRAAILAGAYALLLMHNHPSGDPAPSEADRRLTHKIREAAQLLQINLLDHVIVGSPETGEPAHFSFREAGVL